MSLLTWFKAIKNLKETVQLVQEQATTIHKQSLELLDCHIRLCQVQKHVDYLDHRATRCNEERMILFIGIEETLKLLASGMEATPQEVYDKLDSLLGKISIRPRDI